MSITVNNIKLVHLRLSCPNNSAPECDNHFLWYTGPPFWCPASGKHSLSQSANQTPSGPARIIGQPHEHWIWCCCCSCCWFLHPLFPLLLLLLLSLLVSLLLALLALLFHVPTALPFILAVFAHVFCFSLPCIICLHMHWIFYFSHRRLLVLL